MKNIHHQLNFLRLHAVRRRETKGAIRRSRRKRDVATGGG
jgi:hypothetical protein